ncbi:Gibberellin 2-beta-dioxygenase protein [Dioscorea alata]|uniref:Gibberellin 2-beta-dioxygenase protein n=1 Tax=Dioscorea alata TaxID=55571 RepID=A0ACB7VFE0_DIOAL|nr:Gibberellin 2-beta-dioxygenase protein [Dioscorea alata]
MATNSTTTKHESNDHVYLQAPPPTPSNHHDHHDHHDSFSTSTQLSFILNQILIPPLKPILSSPSISFLLPNHKTKLSLLSTVTRHPFFHLKDLHIHIPSHLPPSSLLESKSLLPSKNFSSLCFNKDEDDDDEDDETKTLLVLEPTSIDTNTLPSLHEFIQCLQKVAMEVLGMLFDGMLDHEGAPTLRFLIWISKSKEKKDELEMDMVQMEMERRRNIKCYPYVMCMQYEMRGRGRSSWVVGDSGELVSIPSPADSLLVTLGDIAQVWSNGRFKKVRGIPFQSSSSNHDYNGDQSFISLTFMVTLPLESTISPLLPLKIKDDNNGGEEEDDDDDGWKRFTPFLMVDYAWKVYHERLTEKDPLIQYRISEA